MDYHEKRGQPKQSSSTRLPDSRKSVPQKRKRSESLESSVKGSTNKTSELSPDDFKNKVIEELEARGWKKYGGNQSIVLYKIKKIDENGGYSPQDKNKVSEIHKGSTNVVHAKPFQAKDREKQALRWTSTLVNAQLKQEGEKPIEVQTALNNENEAFLSTNSNKANNKLNATNQENGIKFLKDMTEKVKINELDKREKRHISKLSSRILADSPQKNQDYKSVSQAFKKPLKIATKGEDGLHAERRIQLEFTNIDPQKIGGIRRPCASCTYKLFPGKNVHSGPFWPTNNANKGIESFLKQDAKELAEKIDSAVEATYVTETSNKLHHNWDTDSDSDTE